MYDLLESLSPCGIVDNLSNSSHSGTHGARACTTSRPSFGSQDTCHLRLSVSLSLGYGKCRHSSIARIDGDHDWMDPEGGSQSVENLRKAGNSQGRMYIVPNAGHHGALWFTSFLLVSSY